MFAVPGICGLIILILARPQEFIPVLQKVPLLHLFTAMAVFGWVIDIRLRRLQLQSVPTLPWVCALFGWAIVGTAVVVPEHLLERGVELAILFALYATIAHGIQKFRTFQLVAGVTVTTCLFICVICFHQGLAPTECVVSDEGSLGMGAESDGRSCEINEDCLGPDVEPGKEYRCEHVGAIGTTSVEQRVRYRGELQDPNEVALTISAGALSLLIAFGLRKRTFGRRLLCILGVGLVVAVVLMTKSRGGLIAAMLVPGVYLVRRYGWWAVLPAGAVGTIASMLGGREGENAAISTQDRYEAWAQGLKMLREHPVFGVGAREFTEHHWLTAHNSFVLTLAEMGFVGMFLFVTIIYMSFKTLLVGLRALAYVPGAAVVQVWGMALLASLAGIVFQINTLSFAYHSVLWIFFGLVGAWYSSIRHHADLEVRFGWKDFLLVLGGCLVYAFVFLPIFLRLKGEM
ncbi:MAG TPA: O-antigen ligase family protein [Kofleriaceae bacterium]